MSDVNLNALQRDFDDSVVGALSKEELDELQKVNAETILNLEADIELLERKVRQFGPGALPNKDYELMCRPDGTSNFGDVENRLRKDTEDFTARLKETMRLTSVTIENINRRVLYLDDNQCKKEFSLELLVLNRKVHLTYTLEEPLSANGKSEQGGKVTWFEIKFEEDINEAVGVDIAKAADELAIHSVFSLLKSFLRWQTDRDHIIKRFTEMYPENVCQVISKDGNKCLKVINDKPNHPEFIIEWSRKTVNARVEPDFKVEVTAPTELVELDGKNILGAVPEMFATMIKTLGVEKAIDGLIQLVTSAGQNLHPEQPPQETAQQEQVELPL